MGNELRSKSALDLLALIRTRQVSPVEVVEASLARIESTQPVLNCFVTVTPEIALAAARNAEREILAGEPARALHGLPISVKDLIAVEGVALTSRSSSHWVAMPMPTGASGTKRRT